MSFSEEAVAALRGHRWPGNIRELKHACESLAYLAEDDVVSGADLESALQ